MTFRLILAAKVDCYQAETPQPFIPPPEARAQKQTGKTQLNERRERERV